MIIVIKLLHHYCNINFIVFETVSPKNKDKSLYAIANPVECYDITVCIVSD